MKELILASSSPRRRELLSIITRRFTRPATAMKPSPPAPAP